MEQTLVLQLFLECWLLSSLRTFCNFFLKITLKFSVLMLKSQLNTYFYTINLNRQNYYEYIFLSSVKFL